MACFAEFGVGKTTLEDIAREAGCSRATVYRYFPGKRALLEGVVEAEMRRLGARLHDIAAEAETLEEFVVEVFVQAGQEFADHDALQHTLVVEPEAVLPHLAFERGNRVLAVGSLLLAPHLARFLPPDEAARVGEWLCRITVTYLLSPSDHFSLTDPDSVRRLVGTFVLPGLRQTEPTVT